jgi:hypothetical protein
MHAVKKVCSNIFYNNKTLRKHTYATLQICPSAEPTSALRNTSCHTAFTNEQPTQATKNTTIEPLNTTFRPYTSTNADPGNKVIADPMKKAAPTMALILCLSHTRSKLETYEVVCGCVYSHELRDIVQRVVKLVLCESMCTPVVIINHDELN